ADDGSWRTYTGSTVAGICALNVVPCPRSGDGKSVIVSAKFSDGLISGRAADRSIKVGEQSVMLSGLRSITRPDNASATAAGADGKELQGLVKGLETVTLAFGDMSATVNLAKAGSISIDPGDHPVHSVTYRVVVR